MGGNAFKSLGFVFPRMPHEIYYTRKARHLHQIQQLYDLVAVPHEAPEKTDHGDIDFVTAMPRKGLTHIDIKTVLGASETIECTGFGTSNYAVPATADLNGSLKDGSIIQREYYQVDIHVCSDRDEWERVVFLHGYGDLGMILGLLARSGGLSFGTNDLKLADPLPTSPPMTFHLCSSVPHILEFFGLSMERWKQGFKTQREIFDWIATSNMFDAWRVPRADANNTARRKAREVRGMYQRFLEYAQERADSTSNPKDKEEPNVSRTAVDLALDYFGKRTLYDEIMHVAQIKQHVREVFTGELVMAWTSLRGMPVKMLMNEVRERLVGNDSKSSWITVGEEVVSKESDVGRLYIASLVPWEAAINSLSRDEVEALVLRVKGEMQEQDKLSYDWRAAKARKAASKIQAADIQPVLVEIVDV